MDIKQLRYFHEIVRLGSFTQAAEALYVAQPAVSVAIRKLEAELDLTLIRRTDRKVTLTEMVVKEDPELLNLPFEQPLWLDLCIA